MTLSVIAELIGIPPRDLERVKEWSLTIAAVLDYKPTWDVMAAGNRMAREFGVYLAEIAAARRARPADDLITRLQAAGGEESSLRRLPSPGRCPGCYSGLPTPPAG